MKNSWWCSRRSRSVGYARWAYLRLLFVGGLLSGCQSLVGPEAGAPASFEVGDNEVGERCRLVSDRPDAVMEGIAGAYSLICGQWKEPSARIFLASGTPTPAAIIGESWWRNRIDHIADCASPVPTRAVDEIPGLALDCTLRNGGWPYQAIAVEDAGKTYVADSIPSAYPATERAIGVLMGRLEAADATATATVSTEIKRLEARIAAAHYSRGDLARYWDMLRLAQQYNYLGDYPLAEQYTREALKLHKEVLPGQGDGLAYLYMHIGLELSNQERFNLADALFARAESYLDDALDPTHEARLISYRALHLANQRRNEEALALARQATAMRREIAQRYGYIPSAPPSPVDFSLTVGRPLPARGADLSGGYAGTALGDVVQSEHLEAAMLVELGRPQEAKQPLHNALHILQQEPRVPRHWEVVVKLQLARIAEQAGEYSRAEEILTSAIALQHSLFSMSRTEGLAYVALGRVLAEQGKATQAMQAFRRGFEIIAAQGGFLNLEEILPFYRIGLAEAERNPTQRVALVAEMFETGQLVRGPVVSQSMALTLARLAAGEQEVGGLIRDLQDAQRERDALTEQLALAQADPRVLAPQVAELEQQWLANKAKIAELERQVQIAAPRYNQLKDAPVSAQQVLDSLRPDEAVAQILVGPDSSFVFFANAEGIRAYEIELTERALRERVNALRYPFEAEDDYPPTFPVARAHALYRALFAPVAAQLQATKHLITVPSSALLSLPFGILVTEPPSPIVNEDYSHIAWMARRHGLTLAPSVQSFVNLRTTVQPSQASASFIGFGGFIPSGDEQALLTSLELPPSCRDEARAIAYAPELPDSVDELRSVAEVFGPQQSKLVLGADFSEPTISATELDDFRIVSFATHGLLPSKLNCLPEPALLVSKSTVDEQDDGLLLSSEVINLKMDADLVVLSACDTGGPGATTGGEALTGLARAFFFSGARSLLVTHWAVPSAPTSRLLTDTFKQAATGRTSLAEALRASQTAMINFAPWSHPKAWAGFSVVGDGGQMLQPTRLASFIQPGHNQLARSESVSRTPLPGH